MAELVLGIIGAVVGVAGFIFGLVTLFRNKKADDKSQGKEDGVVLTELGYIKKGIDGIEHRLEKQENQYIDVVMQLTEVKGEVKRANKRIDKLEKFHTP